MYVAIVAAIAVAGLVIASSVFARTVRSMERQAARERELLLNQLCNLAGKPWAPPPAEEWAPPAPHPDFALVSSPEQIAE